MFLAVQGHTLARVGVVPASDVKAVRASHAPYNAVVNRLDYAAFIDEEPEANTASLSGFGAGSGANISLTIEFNSQLFIKSVDVQTLKAATQGSWGINYMEGAQVQALVGAEWQTVYTFPSGLSSGTVKGPDGKFFSERWASNIPVGKTCSAIRLYKASGYICASTLRPILG